MSQITINATTGYNQWFDLSFSSNKLRQSYLKGFLDISGGSVSLRSDNSVKFHTSDDVIPKLSINIVCCTTCIISSINCYNNWVLSTIISDT